MIVGGHLFHADDRGTLWMSPLSEDVIDTRVAVYFFGLNESLWALSQFGGMFFDYELSRIYYTLEGGSRLLYCAFSPEGTFFGDVEFSCPFDDVVHYRFIVC